MIAAIIVFLLLIGGQVFLVVSELVQTVKAARAGQVPGVSRSAQRAVGWAARLVPSADRGRYHTELLGELEELSQQGRSSRAQVLHATRLLLRAPVLWHALRTSTSPERAR